MKHPFSSIALWVFLGLFVSVALPLGFAQWFLIEDQKEQGYAKFYQQGQDMVDNIALSMVDPILTFDPSRGSIVLELPKKNPLISEIQVYDTFNDLPFLHYRVPDREVGKTHEFHAIVTSGSGEELGWVRVVYSDHVLRSENIERQSLLETAFILISLFLLSIMFPLLYMKVVRPLQKLTQQASRFRDNKLDKEVQWQGHDEVSTLGQTLEMARLSILDLVTKLQEKKKEAEEANNAKSEFLATMSHEIRTPMTGVVSMAELLQNSNLNDSQYKMAQTIRSSATLLRRIIDDILDVSKVEANQIELDVASYCLRDLFEDVAKTLGPEAKNKGVNFQIYIDPAIPNQLECDAIRLRQVLLNLANNAIKFTGKGGWVLMSVQLEAFSPDGHVRLCFNVQDNGIGISKENQPKLFQPFAQAEATTTRKYGGTGLGLYICQQLVSLMKGQIKLQSAPGKGSDFSFQLGFKVNEKSPLHEDECNDFSGLKFLLMAGNARQEKSLNTYLEYWGGAVSSLKGFFEVDAFLNENELDFDSIILDEAWLNTQTPEACQVFFNKCTACAIPIVLIGEKSHVSAAEVPAHVHCINEVPLTRRTFLAELGLLVERFQPIRSSAKLADFSQHLSSRDEAEKNGELVLIAEDNLVNQEVFARQLNWLGYCVDVVSNGLEAIEKLKENKYGILFTDIHMPQCDGFELITLLRENEEIDQGASLPVFAVTAATADLTQKKFRELDVQGFLLKPVELTDLQEVMDQWCAHQAGWENTGARPAVIAQNHEVDDDIIDLVVLESFFGSGNGQLQTVLELFVSSTEQIAQGLARAFREKDCEQVISYSHKFHSAAASIRCQRLAQGCLHMEKAGLAGDWAEVEKLFPQVEASYQEAVRFIEKR
ncbi:putative Histidine kinase [Candidatus Terasakiella magnetica]|uniref:Sensory/regulatory protein RpfC n=1 Tax=Candidatus Terasakiella magnetica TaxID=1867952 RepID=A0A1C3RJ10_9PROT|nr:ATP-binding protein [Candidatus Terasakiella magnetica]SCA57251.1 putative Histidine kinase [Candidatus Terasakiella magnetica]